MLAIAALAGPLLGATANSSTDPVVVLERREVGAEQIALVDRLYPAQGNPHLRRAALLEALKYFPDDPDTQLRIEVRLALLDWADGYPRQAHSRLAVMLGHLADGVDRNTTSWAMLVEARLLAVLGQRAAAQHQFERLIDDALMPPSRRSEAAAAEANLRSIAAPAEALRWLQQVAARTGLQGPIMEAALDRLLLLNGDNDGLAQRLDGVLQDRKNGERILGAVLAAAEEWDQAEDGRRLTDLVDTVRRLHPAPSPGLQAALQKAQATAQILAFEARLTEVLRRKPVAEWAKGTPADARAELETFTKAIDAATRKGDPERSLRLSLRALGSHPADPSFPKLIFTAAQNADWVERSRPAAIDPTVADSLLGLCNLLSTSNPYYTEGKFLAAARALRRHDLAAERSALTDAIEVPDQGADYVAPAYRQLGANLERAGEYRKALEIYVQAEPLAVSHRAAAECVLRAIWINLSFGTDHEAERLIRLLDRSPPAVVRGLAGGSQLRELAALVKTGKARDCWAAARAWWPDWAHLAIALGAPSDLIEYGVPEIPSTAMLEEGIRKSAQAGDFKPYIRDLTILMSAARWQPSLGPEAAALCAAAVKAAGDAGSDLRGILIRMLASPHPAEIPGLRERRLCLALNYLDVHQPQESLRVAGDFFSQAQPDDSTTRAMHRIRALAALAARDEYAASAAGLEADLNSGPADGQRAMAVNLLADLYRRMGRDADSTRLIRQELAGPALADDTGGREVLKGKLARLEMAASQPPPVAHLVQVAKLDWFDEAEPKDLKDPRIVGDPNALGKLDQIFGPVEQVKYLLLAAMDMQRPPEDRRRLFIEATVHLTNWCQTYAQVSSLTTAIVDDPAFDPQIRLGVLWNTLAVLAREGRAAEFEHWRAHPLCQQLSPAYRAQLALLGREAGLDRSSAEAIAGLAASVAGEPLSLASLLLERDALDDLLRMGDVATAQKLAAQSAHWNFAPEAASSAGTFQLELSRQVRLGQTLNPVHEALAAAVRERFPAPTRDLPAAYRDWRLGARLPEAASDETFEAGLAEIAGRTFERQDLQFWGVLFRAWPRDRTDAIDAIVRTGLRAGTDDELRAQTIVLCFTSFDVDDPQVRQQLEREFAPFRSATANPSSYLAIRLYEIDRDLRLGRAVKIDAAFSELNDPRLAMVRTRTLLRHNTQVGDRVAVRKLLDQIEPALLLSSNFVADALPAFTVAGTPSEVVAAQAAGNTLLHQKILAAWSGADPSAANAALDLALVLGPPTTLPMGWTSTLKDSPDPQLRWRAWLVQSYLAGDWPGVERAAASLNSHYPNRYSYYWYRALALHHLGRDREVAAALLPYLDHAHDELNYPAAQRLASAIGLPLPRAPQT